LHWDAASVAVAVVVTVTVLVTGGVVVGEPQGVAAARMGKSARAANFMKSIVWERFKLVGLE